MSIDFLHLNYALFQDVNNRAGSNPALDAFMIFCANTLIFCWPLLLILAWGLPVAWRKRSLTEQDKARLQQRRSSIIWVAIACVLAYAINLTIEQFIFEPRPFVSYHVHLLVQHVADSSFPSDHTAWSFAVFGMLALSQLPRLIITPSTAETTEGILHSKIGQTSLLFCIVALVMASIIGIARIFVGIHYPDDIIGGALDGLIAAIIVTFLRIVLRRPTQAVLHFAEKLRIA